MKVAIIGGTGFVGTYIIKALIERGHEVRALVRAGSEQKLAMPEHCEHIAGDIDDISALDECMHRVDAVIYLIGLLREFPNQGIRFNNTQSLGVVRTADAAVNNNVKRFLLMSANGVEAQVTQYQKTKYRAEEFIRQSNLDWTIFRPSVIYGDPLGRMEFCTQLKRELIDPPIPAPLFFPGISIGQSGQFQMSPVHVEDIAQAFTNALDHPASIGKTHILCGPEAVSWKNIIQTIAAATGRKKLAIPAPALLVKAIALLLGRFPWFPITADQITMLLQGNISDNDSAWRELGVQPRPFGVKALEYLKQ